MPDFEVDVRGTEIDVKAMPPRTWPKGYVLWIAAVIVCLAAIGIACLV